MQVGARRYAHAACALRKAEEESTPIPEIVNPLDNVICKYCNKPMNRKDEDCVALGNGKYAHKKCVEIEDSRELTEQEKLERFKNNALISSASVSGILPIFKRVNAAMALL